MIKRVMEGLHRTGHKGVSAETVQAKGKPEEENGRSPDRSQWVILHTGVSPLLVPVLSPVTADSVTSV